MKYKKLLFAAVMVTLLAGTVSMTFAQEVDTPDPVFDVTLLSPNTNEARNQWASLMVNELPKGGIGVAGHTNAGWDVVGPRTFAHETDVAAGEGIPVYEDGGFDLAFIGLSGTLFYDPTGSYSTETLSPAGLNFAWYQNEEVDDLIVEFRTEFDADVRKTIGAEIQEILYEDQPYIPLVNTAALWAWDSAMDDEVSEDTLLFLSTLNMADQWKDLSHPDTNDLVYGHSYELTEFVPFVQQSYIAAQYMNPIFPGLYERNMTHPDYEYYPVLAAGDPVWNEDNTVANISMNPDATFSNGNPVTAFDVVNTYRFHLTANTSSALNGNYAPFLDTNSSISLINDTAVQFVFNQPYFLAQGVMSGGIMDSTVIGHYTEGTVPVYVDNTTMALTGPNGGGPNGYVFNNVENGNAAFAVGAGPFKYADGGIDVENNVVTLEKVAGYWNGEPALNSLTYEQMTKQAVLSDLEAGNVHIADSQFGINEAEVEGTAGVSYDIVADFGTQFMTVNMEHPIIGTGVDTPLGQDDPSRAAEAAQYVRKAMSHLVPRDTIVDTILEGKGTAATTLWPDQDNAYDDSLEPYEYSVEKAREFLEMAGYEITFSGDGFLPLADFVPVAFLAFFSSLVVVYQRRRN